eukprot:GABV01000749.1.p1 GENE.GABV01000749.1~~GABV01000749.1.p1  ORF type:complete len:359 (-),score=105.42 GABV01000749.1:47-970(-)
MEYLGKIPHLVDVDGQSIMPTNAVLHDRDTKMLLQDRTQKDKVFLLDLERGDVVEEFGAQEEIPVTAVGPAAKYDQLQHTSILDGINPGNLFKMDLRVNSRDKAVQNTQQISRPGFSAFATTGAGSLAVGSIKGEIRMFKDIDGKRAKTLLPGLGDPVLGIDVTEDGRWIVATTLTYLLVVPTSIPDDSKDRTGFDVGMGNKNKPQPFKLQLKPQDMVRYNIKKIRFTPAHFETGENIEESWIVTSTGRFLVTWNFRKIKQGRLDRYSIRALDAKVVADEFRFNRSNQVVVTMDQNVVLQTRSSKRR